MYYIVNKTNRSVVIGDLNYELGPKRALDLEKVKQRHEIDESKDLKTAISHGIVQVRRDSQKEKKKPLDSNIEESDDIKDIKKAIREEVSSLVKGITPQESKIDVNIDNSELIDLIKDMRNMLASGGISQKQMSSDVSVQYPVDTSADLDDETLASIHAKYVERTTKDSTSKVTLDEKNVDDSLEDRVSELDNLLE